MTNAFGYAASAILVVTIAAQIRKQWRLKSTKGVSPLLFVGQVAASAGFVVHSAIIGSTLFVVTNLIVGCAAIVGMVLWGVLRRREASDGRAPGTRGFARDGVVDPACARALRRGFSSPAAPSESPPAALRPAAPADHPATETPVPPR